MLNLLFKTQKQKELAKTLVVVFLVALLSLAPSAFADDHVDHAKIEKKSKVQKNKRHSNKDSYEDDYLFKPWKMSTMEDRTEAGQKALLHKAIGVTENIVAAAVLFSATGIDLEQAKELGKLKKYKWMRRGMFGLGVALVLDGALRWKVASGELNPGIIPVKTMILDIAEKVVSSASAKIVHNEPSEKSAKTSK